MVPQMSAVLDTAARRAAWPDQDPDSRTDSEAPPDEDQSHHEQQKTKTPRPCRPQLATSKECDLPAGEEAEGLLNRVLDGIKRLDFDRQ